MDVLLSLKTAVFKLPPWITPPAARMSPFSSRVMSQTSVRSAVARSSIFQPSVPNSGSGTPFSSNRAKKAWWFAPGVACLIALASYVLFKVWLKVLLPSGLLEF